MQAWNAWDVYVYEYMYVHEYMYGYEYMYVYEYMNDKIMVKWCCVLMNGIIVCDIVWCDIKYGMNAWIKVMKG